MNATCPVPESPAAPAISSLWADRVGRTLPWLAAFLIWLLLTVYMGLYHDAWLYSIQALGRLHPELYGNDIFLRMGSQDDFTIFSPIYGVAITHLGLETAAATLTFLSQLALFAAVWALGRALAPARIAVLSVGLFVLLPSDYGPGLVFHYIEGFITPRLLAEALTVLAIAAATTRRVWLSLVLIAFAALVHPVMASPGIALLAFLHIGVPRPRLFGALCAAFLVGIVVVGWMLPEYSRFHIDAAWQAIVDDHAPYITLGLWTLRDWVGPVGTLAILLTSALGLEPGPARRIAAGTLFVCVYFLAINLLGNDIFHISLIAQGQAYRCLWLGGLISVVLMPLTVRRLWSQGDAGRATILMIVAFWLLRTEIYAQAVAALLVVCSLITYRKAAPASTALLMKRAAGAMLIIAIIISVANNSLGDYNDTRASESIDRMRTLLDDRLILGAALLLVWWASVSLRDWRALTAITVVLIAAIALMLPVSYGEWTRQSYRPPLVAAFDTWRRQIPPGEEVMWYESPFDTWLLLQRPSYFSTTQLGTALFSRPAAMVLGERNHALAPYAYHARIFFPPEGARTAIVPQTLSSVCSVITARFVVSRADLNAEPVAEAPADVSIGYRRYRLYRCDRAASR